MATVTLQLTSEDGTTKTSVSGDFEKQDQDLLDQYLIQMGRLREAVLMQRGIPSITNMSWEAGYGMKLTCQAYSNSEIYELLHLMRPLVLQEERASFNKIMGLLGRRFRNKTFSMYQKTLRTLFEDGELSMYMQITIGDQKLLHSSLLHTWLNGTQYHTDAEKKSAWEELENSLEKDDVRAIVITQIKSRVKALWHLENLINLILSKIRDA